MAAELAEKGMRTGPFTSWSWPLTSCTLRVLAVKPNPCQAAALLRLRGSMKVFGSSHKPFVVPDSGRRSINLISMLSDLAEVVTWEGLSGDQYSRSFPGAEGGQEERLVTSSG